MRGGGHADLTNPYSREVGGLKCQNHPYIFNGRSLAIGNHFHFSECPFVILFACPNFHVP